MDNQLIESIIKDYNEANLPNKEITLKETNNGFNILKLFVSGVEVMSEMVLNESESIKVLECFQEV